jgi:hypothetical protein
MSAECIDLMMKKSGDKTLLGSHQKVHGPNARAALRKSSLCKLHFKVQQTNAVVVVVVVVSKHLFGLLTKAFWDTLQVTHTAQTAFWI